MSKQIYGLIRDWAEKKGIYHSGDSKTQYLKLAEESGELAQALLKRNDNEVYDAIGDCVVVLINVLELYERERLINEFKLFSKPRQSKKIKLEDCVKLVYNIISKRTGSMINGTFVKNQQND